MIISMNSFNSLIYENQNICLTIDLTLNPFFDLPSKVVSNDIILPAFHIIIFILIFYYSDANLINLNLLNYLYLCPNIENLQIIGS